VGTRLKKKQERYLNCTLGHGRVLLVYRKALSLPIHLERKRSS